jgi:hypothetical protein
LALWRGANNVIMPEKIGGAHMASLIIKPDINEFIELQRLKLHYLKHIFSTITSTECNITHVEYHIGITILCQISSASQLIIEKARKIIGNYLLMY